jgi:hypothetical protein
MDCAEWVYLLPTGFPGVVASGLEFLAFSSLSSNKFTPAPPIHTRTLIDQEKS